MSVKLLQFKKFDRYKVNEENNVEYINEGTYDDNKYNQQIGDIFLVGYRVEGNTETGAVTSEEEMKIEINDIKGSPYFMADKDNATTRKLVLQMPISEINDEADFNAAIETATEFEEGMTYADCPYGVLVERTYAYALKQGEGEDAAVSGEDVKIVCYAYVPQVELITGEFSLFFEGGVLYLKKGEVSLDSVPIDTGGGGGGNPDVIVTEGAVITPDLRNVTVSTHDYDETSTSSGSFTLVSGTDNQYDLELELAVQKGDKGEDGDDGQDGADGVGISEITGPSTSGNVDTYTIVLTNGNSSTFTVTNGVDGEDGTSVRILASQSDCDEEGDGFLGDGTTTVLTSNGTITTKAGWLYVLNDTTNGYFVEVGEIKGPKGDDGDDGAAYFNVSQTATNSSNTMKVKFYTDPTLINADFTQVGFTLAEVTGGHKLQLDGITYVNGSQSGTTQTASFIVADGEDGDSAYQVAVKNGFSGTEQQWLASLKGDTGNAGTPGGNATVSISNISGVGTGVKFTNPDSSEHTLSVRAEDNALDSTKHLVKIFYDGTLASSFEMKDGTDGTDGEDGTNFELYRVLLYGTKLAPYITSVGDNPKQLGLLESVGGVYIPTSDTDIQAGKTYYSYDEIVTTSLNGLYGLYDPTQNGSYVYKYNPVNSAYSAYTVTDGNGTHFGTIADLNNLINLYASTRRGGYIIDVCPDTEDPYQIARAMKYGVHGRWHKNGEPKEGAVLSTYQGINVLCCKPLDDHTHMLAFTVKVYKNVK